MFVSERLEQAYAKGQEELVKEIQSLLKEIQPGYGWLKGIKRLDYQWLLFCKQHENLNEDFIKKMLYNTANDEFSSEKKVKAFFKEMGSEWLQAWERFNKEKYQRLYGK